MNHRQRRLNDERIARLRRDARRILTTNGGLLALVGMAIVSNFLLLGGRVRYFGVLAVPLGILLFYHERKRIRWAVGTLWAFRNLERDRRQLEDLHAKIEEIESEREAVRRFTRAGRQLVERSARFGTHVEAAVRSLVVRGRLDQARGILDQLEPHLPLLTEAVALNVLDQVVAALGLNQTENARGIVEKARTRSGLIVEAERLGIGPEVHALVRSGDLNAARAAIECRREFGDQKAYLGRLAVRVQRTDERHRPALEPLLREASTALDKGGREFRRAVHELERALTRVSA